MSPQHLLLGSRVVTDDVYALGATLYELLTGKPPFYAGNIEAQIERVPPPSIAERRRILGVSGAAPIPESWERGNSRLFGEGAKMPATECRGGAGAV